MARDTPAGNIGNDRKISTMENGNEHPRKLVKKLYGVPSDRGGTTWLEECPSHIKPTLQGSEHAFLARYKESHSSASKNALSLCSIQVQSPSLKQLLKEIFATYPGETVDEEEPIFEAPFQPFFHRWASLASAYEESTQEDGEQAKEIGALINILEDEFGATMKYAQNLASNGNITFPLLWTLFPPGCPVFGEWKGKQHCLLVNEAKYLTGEIEPMLSLELLLLDHNGERYGWRKMRQFIQPFAGSMKIAALSAVPLQFWEDCSNHLEFLSARGALASNWVGQSPAYKAYDGPVRLHRPFDMEEYEVFLEGRIIIDPKSHSQQASRYSPSVFTQPHRLECLLARDSDTKFVDNDQQKSAYLPISESLNKHPVLSLGQNRLRTVKSTNVADHSNLKHHSWTEALFGIGPEAFCRSVVRGYCLTSKAWADFETDNIADIRWNKNAFDSLVMSPPRKTLLEALVKQQQNHKADVDVDDVIQGKGQGLVMLLTGPPGTGKTLTAESIADRLQLPLYAVSASELGDTAKEIETHFGQVLRLAASWNAVLLLDEADAFLEKRVDAPEARERNKRVAAFLRILEYYKGTLILTTNRFVNFDDAFYSRIHLTLTFKALDLKSRENIWKNFLCGTEISSSEMTLFASEQLNGRQIKNVMKMARLLAKHTDTPLSSSHISDVLNVAREDFDPIQSQG